MVEFISSNLGVFYLDVPPLIEFALGAATSRVKNVLLILHQIPFYCTNQGFH